MLIGPAEVRQLIDSGDPDPTLVLYEGRAVVVPAGDLEAGRYPGALAITSRRELLDSLGRPVASGQDIEQLAASLDAAASSLGG
jgi:hypothetical protein